MNINIDFQKKTNKDKTRKINKKNKSVETSKRILYISDIQFICVIICSIFMSVRNLPTDIFMYLIPTSGTICATTNVWYFKKAQLENSVKIQLGMIENLMKLKIKYKEYDNHNEDMYFINDIEDKAVNKLIDRIDESIDEALTPTDIQSL